MRMQIIEGTIQIEDVGENTHVTIFPRRSSTHGMTRVELSGADLDPLGLVFEEHHDPVLAKRWLWSGDTSGALRVAHAVMREIDDVLEAGARAGAEAAVLQRHWCKRLRQRFPATAIEPDGD